MRKVSLYVVVLLVLSAHLMDWWNQAGVTVAHPWLWVIVGMVGAIGGVLVVGRILAPVRTAERTLPRPPPIGVLTGIALLAVPALGAVVVTAYLRTPWIKLAVADYILPYFLVMTVALLFLRVRWRRDFSFPVFQGSEGLFTSLGRGLGLFLVYLASVGLMIHLNLSYYRLTMARFWPFIVLAVGLWSYFVLEEGLKRTVAANRGALGGFLVGLASKVIIAGTWLGASFLPNPPAFLTLLMPIVMMFLLALEVLGSLFARWRYSPAAIAAFTALVMAWTSAVTFPPV